MSASLPPMSTQFTPMRQNSLTNGNSPLKLFTHAKTKITEIFKNISFYYNECNKYIDDVAKSDRNLVSKKELEQIKTLDETIDGIVRMISRDHMKVVFFGRTSNGKSTTMNAMLREKILPAGMGHTTNCFLQIEGTDEQEAHVLIPGSDEPKSVQSLGSIGSALSSEKLNSSSLVKILWPREKCRLIKDDVVLVDSPGIDVSADLDQWIDKHCRDADVFVLVISAEATITVTEKNFFHRVAQCLSKPNIFILMNRWDAAVDDEPEIVKSVRQQHLDRGLEFLCDELHVCDRDEAARHRIFFISAREALLSRNNDRTSSPRAGFNEGYRERLVEFTNFEHEFEKCISKTAVQTKFKEPASRGKDILNLLRTITGKVAEDSEKYKRECVQQLHLMDARSDFIEQELRKVTEKTKNRIRHVTENIYKHVSQVLNDEIKRLYSLIEEFERPFSPDLEQIPLYKQDLHRWLENRLGSNLQSRLNNIVKSSLENVRQEIQEDINHIIENKERQIAIQNIPTSSDFSITYRLDCSNLCCDFREDIAFKFSLGLPALWQRYVQNQKAALVSSQYSESPSASSLISSTNDLLTTANNISALGSKSSLLLLGTGALVWKGVGWRVLAIVGGLYGSFYLYEWLMWTKKAQERAFKRQYAAYASSKMKLIVDMISGNASEQVQKQLSTYFAQANRYTDEEKDELAENMQKVKNELNTLLKYHEQGTRLKKQGDHIDNSLTSFVKQYLSPEANGNGLTAME